MENFSTEVRTQDLGLDEIGWLEFWGKVFLHFLILEHTWMFHLIVQTNKPGDSQSSSLALAAPSHTLQAELWLTQHTCNPLGLADVKKSFPAEGTAAQNVVL